MAALKYQSNRPSQQSVFPNDFTSKSTLENDRRKREAVAAAKLQEAQAIEALESERREKEQAAALKIKDLEEKKSEAERTRDGWIEKFNTTRTASDEQIRQLAHDLEEQRNQKDAQINDLRNERRNLEYKVLDELLNEDVQILAITYGSRIYYDSGTADYKNVVPGFKSAAREGRSFRVCNELFNDDPNQNHSKSLIIVYRYNRPGTARRIRTLAGWEGNHVGFDSWN